MTRSAASSSIRGSTLLLAMVLLAVLSVVAVAAVSLSSQERINAATKTHRDRLVACAAAAQTRIWAEMLTWGPAYLDSNGTVPSVTLPDGTRLTAGHYGTPEPAVVSTVVRAVPCEAKASEAFVDLTNRDGSFLVSGTCYEIVARCVDAQNRELEVEFAINKIF